jgi:Kinesin motor domain
MIEIYREGSSKETTLDLLAGYTRVPLQGYSEGSLHEVYSGEELLEKLLTGSGLRNTDATNGNARSSRSHAIMTIKIQYTRVDAASKRARRVSGKFLLVDLAGAEAASAAVANSTQQKQGSGINVGLSALQLVIREVATVGKTLHYRDSKLTHLLKPALGGEDGTQGCNATFLGCVSPSLGDEKRTQNTLNYMQQASNIENSVHADVKMLEAKREAALKKENDKLKSQLQSMAAELQAAVAVRAGGVEEEEICVTATPAVRAEDIVVLSVVEHQELLARRDAAAALEVILQKDQERFSLLQKELDQSKARALEVEEALAQAIAATSGKEEQQQPAQPPPTPVVVATTTALSPAMAALSVSPILLAASRSIDDPLQDAGPLSSRARTLNSAGRTGGSGGDTGGDAISGNETTITASMSLTSTKLDIDDICLSPEISHLAPEQLEVLQKLVRVRLQTGDAPSSSSSLSSSNATSAAALSLQAALKRRTAEVTALRFAVHSYNACLGEITTELAVAKESEKEISRMLHQAAHEKVQYVELVAKHQQALDIAQYDVVTLDAEVKELRRKSIATTPSASSGGGGSAVAVPGSSSGGSGLLNRLIGRSPMASPPVNTPFSPAQKISPASTASPSPSPAASPLFQSPSKTKTPPPAAAITEDPEDNSNTLGQSSGRGGNTISPFPLPDIELDDYDSEYEEINEDDGRVRRNAHELDENEEGEIIDLTVDSPPSAHPTVSYIEQDAVVSETSQKSQNYQKQQQQEQEQLGDLQKRMAGGINVGAIDASRSGTISEEFVEKNQHWRLFQKSKSSTRNSKK